MNGFLLNTLTNRDNVTYRIGTSIMELWRICDGKRTLSDLTKRMSEDHTPAGYAPASIQEMLDLLETKRLIIYP